MVRIMRSTGRRSSSGACAGAHGNGFADVGAGLLAQCHDDVVAVHLGGVGHQVVDIHDQAGAAIGLGRDHGVDTAGSYVDAARRKRQSRIRQVEGDARRLVDGERQGFRSRTAQVQLELHLLTRQGLDVD